MDDKSFITFTKKSDERGTLIPIESYKNVPFNIERIFYIKDVNGLPRGLHANKNTTEVLVPITGSFHIELTDGYRTKQFFLNCDDKGLIIPPNTWLKMFDFSTDCIILVLCSTEYNEKEVIRDYENYLNYINSLSANIKPFDLTLNNELKGQIHKRITNIINTNDYVLGEEVSSFEKAFADYNKRKYCVGVSSGTSALICALRALDLQPNDEVIIQSNAYIAAPFAINECNLQIKIVDIDDTLNIDLNKLENSITERTKVVLVVYLYGGCPDINKLLQLKKKYEFYLIEDCAQAHGAKFNGKNLGTFGDIGCFSFYPTKNLGSFGEGGCVITDNKKYYDHIYRYRNYGSAEKYVWEIKGTNAKLHNLQAAVLNVKLPYLDLWNDKRNIIAQIYNEKLQGISGVQLITKHPLLYCNYHLYVILVENRSGLIDYLENNNISVGIHYPQAFYKSAAFTELNFIDTKADIIADKIISLPMYPDLQKEKVLRVCEYIIEFYKL